MKNKNVKNRLKMSKPTTLCPLPKVQVFQVKSTKIQNRNMKRWACYHQKTPDTSMPRTSPCAVSIERLKIVEQTLVASTGSKNTDITNKEPDKSKASELVGQVSVVGDNHYTTLRESTGTVKLAKSDIIIVSAPRVEKKTGNGRL